MAVASSCSSDSAPSLGTSIWHRGSPQKQEEKKKKYKQHGRWWLSHCEALVVKDQTAFVHSIFIWRPARRESVPIWSVVDPSVCHPIAGIWQLFLKWVIYRPASETAGLAPDHYNKTNILIKRVTRISWFLSAFKSSAYREFSGDLAARTWRFHFCDRVQSLVWELRSHIKQLHALQKNKNIKSVMLNG